MKRRIKKHPYGKLYEDGDEPLDENTFPQIDIKLKAYLKKDFDEVAWKQNIQSHVDEIAIFNGRNIVDTADEYLSMRTDKFHHPETQVPGPTDDPDTFKIFVVEYELS